MGAERGTIFSKLQGIMRDPELAVEIGGPIEIITFPGLVASGKLTEEEARGLSRLRSDALSSLLTPEQQAQADIDANRRARRASEVSGYIRVG